MLSGEIKQTLELWATQRGSQIDQTQVSVCDDVALGPGEGFRLHSDQNCPGIPALHDSRTGTAPVEGTHTHTSFDPNLRAVLYTTEIGVCLRVKVKLKVI